MPRELPDSAAPVEPFRIGEAAAGEPVRTPSAMPQPAGRTLPTALRMDRKTHGRLSRGRMRPEARIDLHGMTLSEAHPALTDFVLSSHGAGRRLLLVITGKGAEGSSLWTERRGVLRQQVPHWLSAARLRPIVQHVLPAHRSHGGSGAYYVWLRRRQR